MVIEGFAATSLTYDEAHCDVVRKAYLVADANEFAATCYGQHLQSQGSTQAEASAACGKPKGDLLVGRRVLLQDEKR